MKRDRTEDIITIAAAEVIKYQTGKRSLKTVFDKPIKTISWPGRRGFNHAGKRMGSLRIVGYIETIGNNSFWLAECICGKYQRLSGSEIGANHKDCCDLCKLRKEIAFEVKANINQKIIDRKIEFKFVNIAREILDPDIFSKILEGAKAL